MTTGSNFLNSSLPVGDLLKLQSQYHGERAKNTRFLLLNPNINGGYSVDQLVNAANFDIGDTVGGVPLTTLFPSHLFAGSRLDFSAGGLSGGGYGGNNLIAEMDNFAGGLGGRLFEIGRRLSGPGGQVDQLMVKYEQAMYKEQLKQIQQQQQLIQQIQLQQQQQAVAQLRQRASLEAAAKAQQAQKQRQLAMFLIIFLLLQEQEKAKNDTDTDTDTDTTGGTDNSGNTDGADGADGEGNTDGTGGADGEGNTGGADGSESQEGNDGEEQAP